MQHDRKENGTTEKLTDAGIAALSATFKNPFKASFSIVMGMGLARLVLFVLGVGSIIGLYKLAML